MNPKESNENIVETPFGSIFAKAAAAGVPIDKFIFTNTTTRVATAPQISAAVNTLAPLATGNLNAATCTKEDIAGLKELPEKMENKINTSINQQVGTFAPFS